MFSFYFLRLIQNSRVLFRLYYGPDSVHAEYQADSCSTLLGLPTCAEWLPDKLAFVKLVTHQVPPALGAWCLIGIVAASMTTADGAILAMGTVFSHNLMRQLDVRFPKLVTAENLPTVARYSTVPFTIAAACIASASRETSYLLTVAFDIVLASVITPLFCCFYAKTPSPRAAVCSILAGASTRIILEFVLPKDGSFLLPFDLEEFYDYGPAASTKFPVFVDAPADQIWDPSTEVCMQGQFKDYTGVDSLSAFFCSIFVFTLVHITEIFRGGRPLFSVPGLEGYEKNLEKCNINDSAKSNNELDRNPSPSLDGSDEKKCPTGLEEKALTSLST
jgi:hypothetical protein